MTQGVTYITPMCILYCILHIRMPLRCAVVAAVSGYGGVSYASGGSGFAKTGLKRFMILTPVIVMRILSRRSLECAQKLVKNTRKCAHLFMCRRQQLRAWPREIKRSSAFEGGAPSLHHVQVWKHPQHSRDHLTDLHTTVR